MGTSPAAGIRASSPVGVAPLIDPRDDAIAAPVMVGLIGRLIVRFIRNRRPMGEGKSAT